MAAAAADAAQRGAPAPATRPAQPAARRAAPRKAWRAGPATKAQPVEASSCVAPWRTRAPRRATRAASGTARAARLCVARGRDASVSARRHTDASLSQQQRSDVPDAAAACSLHEHGGHTASHAGERSRVIARHTPALEHVVQKRRDVIASPDDVAHQAAQLRQQAAAACGSAAPRRALACAAVDRQAEVAAGRAAAAVRENAGHAPFDSAWAPPLRRLRPFTVGHERGEGHKRFQAVKAMMQSRCQPGRWPSGTQPKRRRQSCVSDGCGVCLRKGCAVGSRLAVQNSRTLRLQRIQKPQQARLRLRCSRPRLRCVVTGPVRPRHRAAHQ